MSKFLYFQIFLLALNLYVGNFIISFVVSIYTLHNIFVLIPREKRTKFIIKFINNMK